MTPEEWCKVEELFAAAKDLNPEDRNEFVRQSCGNDNELEREVVSLLRYHDSASKLLGLDNPRWLGLISDGVRTPTFESGVAFGPYLILNLLGSGGMGDVYLAEDTRLRRKVALKLLPAWFNREERLVTRFTQEALAASALNHPNVPAVYEAGEIDQRHFIASELGRHDTRRRDLHSSASRASAASRLRAYSPSVFQSGRQICRRRDPGQKWKPGQGRRDGNGERQGLPCRSRRDS